MRNIWASIVIFLQNFEARYGGLIYTLFLIFVAAALLAAVIRTVYAGKRPERRVRLREKPADPVLKERAAKRLCDMIGFRTVEGEKEQLQALFNYMTETYETVFSKADITIVPDGVLLKLRGTGGKEKNPVLFCGHLDVAPEGKGWERPAFSGVREEGKIYGRGACDCKGPVSALFEAAELNLKSNILPERDVYIALGLDEESHGRGAERIAEKLRDSGLFFDLVLDEGGYIAKSHMETRDYPIALIGIGERENCYFTVKSRGSAGHSSLPGKVTAVGALSEAVCRIEAAGKRFKLTPYAERFLKESLPAMSFKERFVAVNLPYTARLLRWAFKDDPETSSMMTSSLVPTQITGSAAPNMLSGTAECVISAQLLPGESASSMFDYLKALLSDLPVETEIKEEGERFKLTSTDDPMYRLLCDTVGERFDGVPCVPYLAGGCSDARHYSELSNCIIRFSPVIMEKITAFSSHGPNERISEESLAQAVEVYMRLLSKL